MSCGLLQQVDSLFGREEGGFFRVDTDADDERIDEARGPLDHIEVTEGDRIEGAGVNGDAGIGMGHGGENVEYQVSKAKLQASTRTDSSCFGIEPGCVACGDRRSRRRRGRVSEQRSGL